MEIAHYGTSVSHVAKISLIRCNNGQVRTRRGNSDPEFDCTCAACFDPASVCRFASSKILHRSISVLLDADLLADVCRGCSAFPWTKRAKVRVLLNLALTATSPHLPEILI